MRHTFLVFLAFSSMGLTAAACGDDESDGDGASNCAVSSDECVDSCITSQCGASISACSGDTACDAAKDTMVSCVCDAQGDDDLAALDECLTTLAESGSLAATFMNCATASCATPCGL